MLLRVCPVLLSLLFCAVAIGQGAGRGSRGPANSPDSLQRRSQVNQRLQRQIERRSAGQAREFERQAERANLQVASLEKLNRQPSHRNSVRGLSPEALRNHAKAHASLHAQLASGLRTGRPIRLDETERQAVTEIFGDANLLDPRPRPTPKNRRSAIDDSPTQEVTNRQIPIPGWNANPRARLTNAIRIRRAQISELRDRAVETGDDSLLAKADRIEQKLEIFLHNQERVEANLEIVRERIAARSFGESDSGSGGAITDPAANIQLDDNVPVPTDAGTDDSGLITDSQN